MTKGNIKLSRRDRLGRHHGPIGNLRVFPPRHRQIPQRNHWQRLMLAIDTNTSPSMDLATSSRLLIGNHPHRQLSCRPATFALPCRSILYRSWTRAQKQCQQARLRTLPPGRYGWSCSRICSSRTRRSQSSSSFALSSRSYASCAVLSSCGGRLT